MNTVLINLEILGTIEANQRVGTEGSATFVVYRPTLGANLTRTLWGETRKLNVDRIELCVSHALAQLRAMCRDPARDGDEQRRAIEHLARHLRSAVGGLRNLMATYSDDVGISARIRSLVDAIANDMVNLGLASPSIAATTGAIGASCEL